MRHGRRGLIDDRSGRRPRRLQATGGRTRPRGPRTAALVPTLLLASTLLLSAACGDGREDASSDPHQELRVRLGLDADREIHRVALGGRRSEEHVAPTRIQVGIRAVVEFVTVDGRIHTVSFPEDSLPLDAALFLRGTAQLRSPPLVDRGSRFVVDFEDAPPARYRFLSEGPGGEAWGVVVVGEPEEAPRDR